jgi:hypothetical protein
MCGIAGAISPRGIDQYMYPSPGETLAKSVAAAIERRADAG